MTTQTTDQPKNELIQTKQPAVIDSTKYAVSATLWEELIEEINRINVMIDQNQELKPTDIKKAKQLAAQVNNFSKEFRSAVTKQAAAYKKELENMLVSVGYPKIEEYVVQKRKEQQLAISQRLTQKTEKFQTMVQNAVNKFNLIAQSELSPTIIQLLGSRFPKLKSGAANNEISDAAWNTMDQVINKTLETLMETTKDHQMVWGLPLSSQTMQLFMEYLKLGDPQLLEKYNEALSADKKMMTKNLRQQKLKQHTQTASQTVTTMKSVLDSDVDDETKISRIRQLLFAYESQK